MLPACRLPALLLGVILGGGLAASCGGEAGPTTPTPMSSVLPTLSSIQSNVFTPRCVEHHGDHGLEAGLTLEAGQAWAALVNVPSTQVAIDLVEPNDAENSYLIHKLEGRPGIVGTQMPVGAAPLSAMDIDVIKQWINRGAPNN